MEDHKVFEGLLGVTLVHPVGVGVQVKEKNGYPG